MDYKIKCEELRKIRVKVENDLGLTDIVRKTPCTFQGECIGTCPACEMEERVLMEEIYKISQKGELIRRQKPEFIQPIAPPRATVSDTSWAGPYNPNGPSTPQIPRDYPATGMPAPFVQGQIRPMPEQWPIGESDNRTVIASENGVKEKKGLLKKMFGKGK